MTRRLLTAALALSVAGGVYLASAPAQASNMGFKLERDLDFKRDVNGRPLANIYMISLPYFNGMGDVANSLAPGANKCVGDPAGGQLVGDDWINVDDAICDWWEARNASNPPDSNTAGTFALSYYNRADCIPVTRTVSVRFQVPTFPATTSTIFPPDDLDGDPSNNTDLWTGIGYQVNLAASPGFSPTNRIIIVGSHDPAFPGQPIQASATCSVRAAQIDLIAVPYHTMYRRGIELHCGLEFTDWDDDGLDANDAPAAGSVAGDGFPDHFNECDTSVFDGANLSGNPTPPGRATLAISRWYNDPPPGVSGAVSCTVTERFGNINFAGCAGPSNFDLVPGEAYMANISRTHTAVTTFLSPHF